MSLVFLEAGLQTSIQDRGRQGYFDYGVGQSGAMDRLSLALANWLLGNPLYHPAIEVTLLGPEIEFQEAVTLAVTGAEFDLKLNGKSIGLYEAFDVDKGDRLSFGSAKKGMRAYLAVAADFAIKPQFGSYSTHLTARFGGFNGRAFTAGDKLALYDCRAVDEQVLAPEYKLQFLGDYVIRCIPSVETERFSKVQLKAFQAQSFNVSVDSNRMGIRLEGEKITFEMNDIVSMGLMPGTIQLPPSGQPIIAGVDAQTIGGYPRIAQVAEVDKPLLGQLRPGDSVTFQLITLEQARSFYQDQALLMTIIDEPHSIF